MNECPDNYNDTIYNLFGECVTNGTQLTGVILGIKVVVYFIKGLISIMCWFVAQFPQLLQNYRRKNVDSLSFTFVLNWVLGDLTNLIGCILTDQSPTQARRYKIL
jgi:uncharacterized protein with PQ loop repeat